MYKRVLVEDPNHFYTRRHYAKLLSDDRRRDRFKEAMEMYEKALEIDPNH